MNRVALSLGLASVVLTACAEEIKLTRSDEGRPIKMLTVGKTNETQTKEYLGSIAAAQEVQLSFEVPGQIVEFTAISGQRVAAGELLAKIDPVNYEATMATAVAQLDASRADVERKRKLVEIGGVSRVALEEAERRLTAAESDVATATKRLNDTELRAPFAGVVAETLQENFANVRMKQAVLTLQDPTWMEIEVSVPETDAVLAEPGLTLIERNKRLDAKVIVSALPDREFDANISEFSTTADPVTHTYSVTLVFETPADVSVLAGMTAHVSVDRGGRGKAATSFRLPVQVVAGDSEKEPYVWVIQEDMTAARRSVTVGEMSGSMIQVLTGLELGDRVALTGVHHLREGLSVREWEAK